MNNQQIEMVVSPFHKIYMYAATAHHRSVAARYESRNGPACFTIAATLLSTTARSFQCPEIRVSSGPCSYMLL